MSPAAQAVAFRRAIPADQAGIEALVHNAYAKWVPIVGRKPLPMRADYAAALREHRIDLLVAGEMMQGLIETVLEPDHLFIVNIAVAPAAQGQGLGTLLLEHAERVAIAAGKSEIRLATNALMAENVALYGRRGYRVSREEHPEPGWTVVHMIKPI
jgi:ribosomal protein S18 acetylase RimI-like enzyme